MDFYYTCRHCQMDLGKIPEHLVSWEQLGFNNLAAADFDELLLRDFSGDFHVKVICEDCEGALLHNPGLHGIDYIIQ